jgi:hypothetical protein
VDVSVKAQTSLSTFTPAKTDANVEFGCSACVRSGLEWWAEQTTTAGDAWFSHSAALTKGNCCLPGNLSKTTSCDVTGMTTVVAGIGALATEYAKAPGANSSR